MEVQVWYLKDWAPPALQENYRKQDIAHSELRNRAGTRAVGVAIRRVAQPIIVSHVVVIRLWIVTCVVIVESLCGVEASKSLFATAEIRGVKFG
jgi:hypothetical protein